MSKYARLTENDRSWWRFDLGRSGWARRRFAVELDSGGDADEGSSLNLSIFGWMLRLRLPSIVKRHEIRHDAVDPHGGERGRASWSEFFRCRYGFSVNDGFLQVFMGAQTWDSTTTKSWSCFLPWTQWRFHRRSWHGLDGEELRRRYEVRIGEHYDAFNDDQKFEASMPKVIFDFYDYDGSIGQAVTFITEREWLFGEKWCKWLSMFRRPKIIRSLDISFVSEVGPDTGSWKGGLMGTSISLSPGETHESGFSRYCAMRHSSKHGLYRIKPTGVTSVINVGLHDED